VFGEEGSGFFANIETTIITLFSGILIIVSFVHADYFVYFFCGCTLVMHSDSIWDTLQSSAPFNSDVKDKTSYPEADILSK
jgi:hypothetical protein